MKNTIGSLALAAVLAAGVVQIVFFAQDYQQSIAAYEQTTIDYGAGSGFDGLADGLPTWN